MKIIFIYFIFQLIIVNVYSQLNEEWTVILNGSANANDNAGGMVFDSSGNIIISCTLTGTTSQRDIGVIKFAPDGTELWRAVYDNNNLNDRAGTIMTDSNYNIYVSGYSYGSSQGDDIVMLKYSSDGILVWAYTYNSPENYDESARPFIDKAGNIYLAGNIYDYIYDENFLLIKLNRNGIQQWLINPNQPYYGGFYDIITDNYGDVYVTGHIFDSAFARYDIIAQKYSSNGKLRWSRRYGLPHTDDYSSSIALDGSGNVIICGNKYNGNYAIKYDNNGNLIWITHFGISPWDFTNYMTIDKDNNIYIAGATLLGFTTFTTVKLSSTGELLWKNYRGCGYGNNTEIDNAMNVYTVGNIYNDTINNGDIGIVKYNSSGVQQWFVMYNAPASEDDEGNDILIDGYNNVYILGTVQNFYETTDIILSKYSQLTKIEPISQNIPDRFELYQNYPNPFNPKTILRFALPEGRGQKTEVRLVIYNSIGQVVETLVNESAGSGLNAGTYEVEFDGTNLASGVYYYSLVVSDASTSLPPAERTGSTRLIQTRKMVLIK